MTNDGISLTSFAPWKIGTELGVDKYNKNYCVKTHEET